MASDFVLIRAHISGQEQGSDAFVIDIIHLIELEADERLATLIMFDLDDIDAAFEELDARYVAGEAALRTDMALVTQAQAALDRHELPPLTPDWVNLDHRRAMRLAG